MPQPPTSKPAPPIKLKWRQVLAWRLRQQALAPRWPAQDFVAAASRLGGVQAQVLSAAELALSARVDALPRDAVAKALWRDHTVLKTWAMRATLHLIAAADLPLLVAARAIGHSSRWDTYYNYFGISPAQSAKFLAAVPEVLGSEAMTREQLAHALAKHTRLPQLRELITTANWGSPLKPAAFRGDLCFGPSQGPNVTFVCPRSWISAWPELEPMAALQEVVRRYLLAYGPATRNDFARWWGAGAGRAQAKQLFKSLGDELVEVDVEGWRASALRSTVEALQTTEPTTAVQLLPLFDGYTFQMGQDMQPLLPPAVKPLVFRPQGWVSATVLVDGWVRGVWEYVVGRQQTVITVRLFEAATARIKRGLGAEAARLGAFLNSPAVVKYAPQ